MTTEEKARAYDEALERAKKLHKDALTLQLEQDIKDYEYIFPELKESEDERIRKELIAIFKGQIPFTSEEDAKKYIAWLEKQTPKTKWAEEDSLMIDSIIDTMKWLEGKGTTDMKIDWLKTLKQRMQ